VFGFNPLTPYQEIQERDSKKGEDTTGEKEKSRKAEKDRVGRGRTGEVKRKYGKQIAALGVGMVGSWFVR